MGKVGDDGTLHFEIDLDGRTAELGVGGGAGIGVRQPPQPGDIAGQFDDALIVDVVQHVKRSRAFRYKRPWRVVFSVLYMNANAGNTVRPPGPAHRDRKAVPELAQEL